MKNFKKIICTVAVLIFFIVSVDIMASNSSIVDNDGTVTSNKKEYKAVISNNKGSLMNNTTSQSITLDVQFERADETGALYKVSDDEYYLTDDGAYKVNINAYVDGELVEIDKNKLQMEVDTSDYYIKDAISYNGENGVLNIKNIPYEYKVNRNLGIKFIYEGITQYININLSLGELITFQPKDIQGNYYKGEYLEVTRVSHEYNQNGTGEKVRYTEDGRAILQTLEMDKYSYCNLLLVPRNNEMGSTPLINIKEKIKNATLENGVYNLGDISFQKPNIIINSYGIDGKTPNTRSKIHIRIQHGGYDFADDIIIYPDINGQIKLGDLGDHIWDNVEGRKFSIQALGIGNVVGSSKKVTIDYDPNNTQTIDLVERVTGIKGNIKGQNGETIKAYTKVTLFDSEGNELDYKINPDAFNSYFFEGLEIGKEYEVIAEIDRNHIYHMIFGLPEEAKYYTKSKPYRFTYTGELENKDLVLEYAQIQGYILSKDNNGKVQADIQLITPSGKTIEATTDYETAFYAIGGFEPEKGEYTLKVKGYYCEPYEEKFTLPLQNSNEETLERKNKKDIYVTKNSTLSVKVLDIIGNEFTGLCRISIATDEEVIDDMVFPGLNKIWELKKGKEYTVTVYPYENSEAFSEPYTFVSGSENHNIEIQIIPPVVKGTIKNSITEELINAEVSIILPNGEKVKAYGVDGNYAIGGFWPTEGEYTIQAVVRDADNNISKYYEPYEAKIHIGKDYKLPIIHEIVMKNKPLGAIKEYDVNKDGLIDIKDVEALFEYVNLQEGHANFDPSYDYNDDKVIDIYDLLKININEIGLTATVKQQAISSKLSISLTNAPSNITKYQPFDGDIAIGRISLINEEVVVFPKKYPGDKITIKFMTDKNEVVKVMEVTLK